MDSEILVLDDPAAVRGHPEWRRMPVVMIAPEDGETKAGEAAGHT